MKLPSARQFLSVNLNLINLLQVTLAGLLIYMAPSQGKAWGGRGHHIICSAASFLVKEEGLRDYLKSRPQMMGHLCNIPDAYWKSLGSEAGRLGNSTHFIDVEITGAKIQDISTDYQKIINKFTGTKNQFKKDKTIFSIPTEFGSLWWRADQFFRRAVSTEREWKKAAAPASPKEEQDENLPYNKMAYDFIVNLGLMGHFVGDAGQPFHGTADYDGYAVGHGGIHAYFEDAAVNSLGYDLESHVVEAAMKPEGLTGNKTKTTFLTVKSVVEKMKLLSQLTFEEIPLLIAIDPIKKPSEVKEEKGMELRTAAEREDIKTVSAKFEPHIVLGLARSAALLAQLWDQAYVKVGKPKLAAYKSYKYPFTPDFVAPDYFEDTPTKK